MVGHEAEIHPTDITVRAEHQSRSGQYHKSKSDLSKHEQTASATAAICGQCRSVLPQISCDGASRNQDRGHNAKENAEEKRDQNTYEDGECARMNVGFIADIVSRD